MRYPASEKLEIIRTVEASHLPVKQTLAMLGIPSSTYYDWYARWNDGGIDALTDRSPRPRSVWNRIPDKVRGDVVDFALEHEDLTPRELAVKYTDEKRYFVSESSMYRILKERAWMTTGGAEGWAHYTEEMMLEAGLRGASAETRIGQLGNALLRNVRFLSAIGLHTRGMTVAESEKMFMEEAYQGQGTAMQQAARGTYDPAYLNYTLGKLMIRELREDWTGERGGRADWKAFHDTFLSFGGPPIPLVRARMMRD